ncbi:MAG: TOBE domain-containing protein, partial [Propionibacteriaceae bacterium]|nr:TOBE domain-containing protein [Propionibacteriaceae bacterium]
MRISARNQIKGVISKITPGAVNTIVAIKAGDIVIQATITNQAVADLALKEGDSAYAIIKASHVMVGIDD